MSDCASCGAPVRPGFVRCPFCRGIYSKADASRAIPCRDPACNELSVWGSSKCVRCQGWLVVECVFCKGLSPHNQPACLACGEVFAGSTERKAAAEQQRQAAATQQAVLTYAPVAMTFLGTFAGAVASSAFSGGSDDDSGGVVGSIMDSLFD